MFFMKKCSICGSEMYEVKRSFPSSSAYRTINYDGSVDIYGGTVPLTAAWQVTNSRQVEEVYWKCPNCGNYESERAGTKAGSM